VDTAFTHVVSEGMEADCRLVSIARKDLTSESDWKTQRIWPLK